MFQVLAAAKSIPSWSPLTVSPLKPTPTKRKERQFAQCYVGPNNSSTKAADKSNSGNWWQVQYSNRFIVVKCQSTKA